VLAGPGLGDDAMLTHPVYKESLAERIIYLVGTGMGEVLSLEVDPGATELPA
jgi:hypothetical protein